MPKKFKIIRKAPFISKEEIAETKDFDQILSRLQGEQVSGNVMPFRYKAFIVASLFAVSTVIFLFKFDLINTSESIENRKNLQKEVTLSQPQTTKPEVKDLEDINADNEQERVLIETEEESISSNNEIEKEEIITKEENQPAFAIEGNKEIAKTDSDLSDNGENDEVVTTYTTELTPYTEAYPTVGFDSLYSYFGKSLHYPDSLKQYAIEGQVVVAFSINEEGKPTGIEVREGLHEILDNEAVRIVNQMPLWIPAKAYGEPIISTMSIPITFELK